MKVFDKTALVIEGGGFRGNFSAGVLEVLLQNKLFFSYAVGISAGASYGASYVSEQEGRNLQVNRYIGDKRYSSLRNLVRDGSLFSWNFIYDVIPNKLLPFDYMALSNSPTQFWVGATNCETGSCEFFLLNNSKLEDFKTILAASCSLPLIAPIVKFNNNLYLDGGLADSIPYEHALAQGNTKALVILTRPKGYVKKPVKYSWIYKWFYRRYPNIVASILARPDTYNKSLKKLEELEKHGKVFVIRPEKEIEVSRLENNPEKTEKVYYSGMELTNNLLPDLRKWLAT